MKNFIWKYLFRRALSRRSKHVLACYRSARHRTPSCEKPRSTASQWPFVQQTAGRLPTRYMLTCLFGGIPARVRITQVEITAAKLNQHGAATVSLYRELI